MKRVGQHRIIAGLPDFKGAAFYAHIDDVHIKRLAVNGKRAATEHAGHHHTRAHGHFELKLAFICHFNAAPVGQGA